MCPGESDGISVPVRNRAHSSRSNLPWSRSVRENIGFRARGPASLKRRFYGAQVSSPLTPRDVKRVIALLEEIESLLRRAKRRRAGGADDIYRWTSVFVPLGRKRS